MVERISIETNIFITLSKKKAKYRCVLFSEQKLFQIFQQNFVDRRSDSELVDTEDPDSSEEMEEELKHVVLQRGGTTFEHCFSYGDFGDANMRWKNKISEKLSQTILCPEQQIVLMCDDQIIENLEWEDIKNNDLLKIVVQSVRKFYFDVCNIL